MKSRDDKALEVALLILELTAMEPKTKEYFDRIAKASYRLIDALAIQSKL